MTPAPRHCVLFVAILLVSLLPVRADVITDNAGWFAVDMPLPTQRDSQFADSAVGKLRVFTMTHEGKTNGYNVTYSDYPDGSLAGRDPGPLYDVLVKAQLAGMQGVLRSMVPSQLGQIAGREAIVDIASQQAVVRLRTYFVGDRVFQIMYLGAAGTENNPEVLKFLNSFRLIHIPKAAQPAPAP